MYIHVVVELQALRLDSNSTQTAAVCHQKLEIRAATASLDVLCR